jgi:hypothetical protein
MGVQQSHLLCLYNERLFTKTEINLLQSAQAQYQTTASKEAEKPNWYQSMAALTLYASFCPTVSADLLLVLTCPSTVLTFWHPSFTFKF